MSTVIHSRKRVNYYQRSQTTGEHASRTEEMSFSDVYKKYQKRIEKYSRQFYDNNTLVGIDYDDLVQEFNLVLYKVFQAYQSGKGYVFEALLNRSLMNRKNRLLGTYCHRTENHSSKCKRIPSGAVISLDAPTFDGDECVGDRLNLGSTLPEDEVTLVNHKRLIFHWSRAISDRSGQSRQTVRSLLELFSLGYSEKEIQTIVQNHKKCHPTIRRYIRVLKEKDLKLEVRKARSSAREIDQSVIIRALAPQPIPKSKNSILDHRSQKYGYSAKLIDEFRQNCIPTKHVRWYRQIMIYVVKKQRILEWVPVERRGYFRFEVYESFKSHIPDEWERFRDDTVGPILSNFEPRTRYDLPMSRAGEYVKFTAELMRTLDETL